MPNNTKTLLPWGITTILLIYLAWRMHLFVYALLFSLGAGLVRYRLPELGWPKAAGTGLFLCLFWYLANLIAFFSLAPVGEIGFFRTLSDLAGDMVKYPEIVGLAFQHSLYRTRLATSALSLGLLTVFTINSPFGRDLGLHRIFKVPGGYKISRTHSQGSARWATEKELRRHFKSHGPGIIVGKNKNNHPYILPYHQESFDYQRNHNVIVLGATGTGKSASFVRPNILQADASMVITDPKEELYHEMAPYLKKKGYNIYRFNLVNMHNSHRWNPLVKKDGSRDLTTQDANLISSSIIKNTRSPNERRGDPFWESSEQALLTALILYASRHFQNHTPSFGNILKFATSRRPEALDYDFGRLDMSDPARAAYNIYAQAPEKVRGSIIISLGTRLQLWQDSLLSDLTSRSDFDLAELGQEKTAIFVAISDFDSTYYSISALFFTQAFQELYKLASKTGGTLPVFTRFIMDEFCNIGYIPDFTQKLSTMRSRGISAQMIVQSLGQLENRYPFGQADEIIGNCDTKLMLGANDAHTTHYIVDLIGKTTVEQHSHSRSDKVVLDAGGITRREVGRHLITPDELLRLDNREALLIVRGIYPAKIQKLYYKEHPEAIILEHLNPLDSAPHLDAPQYQPPPPPPPPPGSISNPNPHQIQEPRALNPDELEREIEDIPADFQP